MSDILFGRSGAPYCVPCGVPFETELDLEPQRRSMDRAPRVVAAVMLSMVLFCWVAAFVSQM